MPLASVVLDEARFLLNDVSAKLYTNTVLLPALRKAYRELQQNLRDNSISTSREASAALTVLASSVPFSLTFSSSPAIPADLLYPIKLDEKFQNQGDESYVSLKEKDWSPDITPSDRLQFWAWNEDQLKFVGVINTVILRIKYWKGLAAIVDSTTDIPILDCETFLAARTAALAAYSIGGKLDKASILQSDASEALELLIGTSVKNRQGLPVRRRPFRPFRFGGRIFWR
mgnify:CR=1 FL=1